METENLTVIGEWTLASDGATDVFISAVNAAGYSAVSWLLSDEQPGADIIGHPLPSDGAGFKSGLMVWLYTSDTALAVISRY